MACEVMCLIGVSLSVPAYARTILVPPQPVSPYLDTEVSTNCVLHKSRIDARTFDVHFQFEGAPTNSLEVAFGRDSNTNGVLDVQEIDTVYGWRGGRYFIENVRAWERIEAVADTRPTGEHCSEQFADGGGTGGGTRAAGDSPVASPLDATTPMPDPLAPVPNSVLAAPASSTPASDPLAPVPNSVLAARSATISGCHFERGEEIGYTFEELALVRS